MNWNNIQATWRAQFKIGKSHTGTKYDYQSIMHYPMHSSQIAIDSTKPLMTPINCAPNCPKTLGTHIGLSKLD
jgi:hypothetical protein